MEEPRASELRARSATSAARRSDASASWSFALEALTAAEEREAVAEIESLGYRAIWFPESVESREVFAHAAWILASTERAIVGERHREHLGARSDRDGERMADAHRRVPGAVPARDRREPLAFGRAPGRRVRAAVLGDARLPRRDGPRAVLGPRAGGAAAARARRARAQDARARGRARARRASVLRPGRAHRVRAAAPRPGPVLAVEQTVVLESDPSEARRVARGFALDYLQTENYARNLKRMGWTDADMAGQGSDAIIDAVIAWGDVDRVALRVRAAPGRGRGPRVRPGRRRGRARSVPAAAPRARARARCNRARDSRRSSGFRRRACTASLRSSRRASRAIHRAARESIRSICSAVRIACELSPELRLPICRSAHETAFFT